MEAGAEEWAWSTQMAGVVAQPPWMRGATLLLSTTVAKGAQAAGQVETQAVFCSMMPARAVEWVGEREIPMQLPRRAALPGALVAEVAEASATVLRFSQTAYRHRMLPPTYR
jgi:hypothetical protein